MALGVTSLTLLDLAGQWKKECEPMETSDLHFKKMKQTSVKVGRDELKVGKLNWEAFAIELCAPTLVCYYVGLRGMLLN